jgi:uncharacterized protein
MKKFEKAIILTVVLCFLFSVTAFAINLPEPTNNFFVNDFANVISEEDEKEIMAIGASLFKQTTAQVVVVTVDSLEGADVNEYALELGRKWGVGDEEKDNGVVLLLSVSDRKITIQVGYGLEGCLTDIKTGRILDEYAIPYLSEDDFSQGLKETFKAITTSVYEEYGVTPEIDYDYSSYEVSDGYTLTAGDIITSIIIIGIVILVLSKKRGPIFIGPFIGHGGFGNHGGGHHHGGGGFSSGGGFSGGGGSFGGGGSSRGF